MVIFMSDISYSLFPEIAPYSSGFLNTATIHQIYFEECGNPNGSPVVFLHGGPGSGCNPAQRRFFDPSFYRIILLDQRGCGRSTPQGETSENTTDDLIADINALRIHLNIEKWLVFGGSWGSTLAICYAQAFPQHVTGLILRGIFLSRSSELNWFLGEIAHFYPDVWHTLTNYLPAKARGDVLAAFSQRVFSEHSSVNIPAALAWNAFENAIMRLIPNYSAQASVSTNEIDEVNHVELARARIQIHYIENRCFIDGQAILENCGVLKDIPTTIVQGRYDMVCPPQTAWELSKIMPHAELLMIPDAGHSAMETGVVSALIGATEKFKRSV